MVEPDSLIGKTFKEAYDILGVPKLLKHKDKIKDIRTGRLSATNTLIEEEEPAEQLQINSLEEAIFAMDIADAFKADGTIADSSGAGTIDDYTEYVPPKPGFLQKLKKNHPWAHKGLVIAATVLTVGIAAFALYSVSKPVPVKEKPKPPVTEPPVTEPSLVVPSYIEVSTPFYGDSVHLVASEPNLANESVSLDVLTLDGHTIAKYKFNPNITGMSYSPGSIGENYSKGFLAFLDYPNNNSIWDSRIVDALYNNSYILKILAKGKNSSDSLIEVKTIPQSAVNSASILFYNWGDNYGFAANMESLHGAEINVSYNYTIYDLNKNIVSHQDNFLGTTPSYIGGDNEHRIYANVSKGLFNSKQLYTLNLDYVVDGVSADGKSISYSGYINNAPFVPEKSAKIPPY